MITSLVPLKYLIYTAMLSDVTSLEEADVTHAVCGKSLSDIYDAFQDWEHKDSRLDLCQKSLDELVKEGLIMLDDEDEELVYLGEIRGRRLFTFEVKNSLSDVAVKTLLEAVKQFKKSKSAITKSRGGYLQGQIDELLHKGIDKLTASDYTELHGILYELYTGGEIYILRNKVEYFQTANILKAYDKFTTFAIIVEGVLNYDNYRKNGVPTVTNVAFLKDDIFRHLSNPKAGSKDYMRDITDSGEF